MHPHPLDRFEKAFFFPRAMLERVYQIHRNRVRLRAWNCNRPFDADLLQDTPHHR